MKEEGEKEIVVTVILGTTVAKIDHISSNIKIKWKIE